MFQYYIKIICSILIFLTSSSFSFGQSNSDYFVSLDNDTLYGEVTLSTNYSKRFLFKPLDNNKIVTYKASEARGFSDDGHIYHSLKLDGSLTYEIRELLVDGHIKLYERSNSKEIISFIVSKNGELTLLEQKIVIERNRAIKKPQYLRALKKLLEDQPQFVQKVDRVKFKRKDLSQLIYDYNFQKSKKATNYSNNRYRIKLLSTFEISSSSKGIEPMIVDISNRTEITKPNISLGYLIGLKNKRGQMINIGVEISRFSNTSTKTFDSGTTTWKYNNYLLSIPLRMNFQFGNHVIKPIVFGEFTYAHFLNKKYNYEVVGPLGRTDEDRIFPAASALGYRCGLGVAIHSHFHVLIKYSSFKFDDIIGNIIERNVRLNPYTVSIGYTL